MSIIDIIFEAIIEVYDEIVFENLLNQIIAIITPLLPQIFDTFIIPFLQQFNH